MRPVVNATSDGRIRMSIMNTNIENYIRYTYPSRDIKEGLALYNRGHVSGPDILSDDVYIYHVHETTCHARVLIWEGKYSAPISVTCSNNLARNRYCVACLNAHSKFRSSGDMSYNPALQAKGLPESIANHPLFDIRYELEGWHEESNSEVFEEVAGEFVGRLLRSNRHPREIVDALDLAVNECNRYDRFDASYAATIIADSRDDVSSLLSTMDDMDLVRILSNTDRQYSRKWILGSRDGINERVAADAYMALLKRNSLSQYDCEIQGLLADTIGDPKTLVSLMDIEEDFYGFERMATKEFGRGHVSISRAIVDRIPPHARNDHHLEYARLRRSVGLPDDEGHFIQAFYQEPNGKRLIDVLDSHPDIEPDVLFNNAWHMIERTPMNLTFYCRNDMDHLVTGYIDGLDDDEIGHMVCCDPDSTTMLAETLMDNGGYEQSSRLLMAILDEQVKTPSDVESAVHTMQLIDGIFNRVESPTLDEYIKGFRCRVRKRNLWQTYREYEGGHF